MYRRIIKRLIDIICSLLGMIILLIPMIIVSLLIIINDPGSPIFVQKRYGINKSFFNLYKFRSMKLSTPHDVPTHLLENPDQYFISCGKFIRKYSLDELPQLFNVLMGNMSIVGPRPALWNQSDLIELRDKYNANCIRPGITGWAQINGRDELPLDVKAQLDGEYVKKESLLFDIKCVFLTVLKVIKHEGVVEGKK